MAKLWITIQANTEPLMIDIIEIYWFPQKTHSDQIHHLDLPPTRDVSHKWRFINDILLKNVLILVVTGTGWEVRLQLIFLDTVLTSFSILLGETREVF